MYSATVLSCQEKKIREKQCKGAALKNQTQKRDETSTTTRRPFFLFRFLLVPFLSVSINHATAKVALRSLRPTLNPAKRVSKPGPGGRTIQAALGMKAANGKVLKGCWRHCTNCI